MADVSSLKKTFEVSPGILLRELFLEFGRLAIPYCVMNNYEHMPEEITSDVDIAIAPDWIPRLDKILDAFAKEHGIIISQKIWSGYQQVAYILTPLRLKRSFQLQLDFFQDLCLQGFPCLIPSEKLLSNRKPHKGFFIPNPEVESTFLIMRRIVKNDIRSDHIQKLQKLVSVNESQVRTEWDIYFGQCWTNKLLKALTKSELEQIRDVLSTGLKALEKISRNNQSARYRIIYFLANIKRVINRFYFPVGMAVALLGPDGGGKTTIGEELTARVSGSFHGAKCLYWRPRLLPAVGKLAFWNPAEEATENSNPHRHSEQKRLKSLLRFFYYLCDYWAGYFANVYLAKVRKKFVLFDRYYYDFLVDLRRYQMNIPSWLPRLILPLIPAPDLTVYLDAEPEELIKRKQELSIEELQRQVEIYRSIVPMLSNALIMRTEGTIDEIVEDLACQILAKSAQRTRQKLNAN